MEVEIVRVSLQQMKLAMRRVDQADQWAKDAEDKASAADQCGQDPRPGESQAQQSRR